MLFSSMINTIACGKKIRNNGSGFCLALGQSGRLLFSLMVALILLVASGSGVRAQNPDTHPDSYKFGAGDVLEVLVFGEPEISKTVFVRSDGRISLPLVGEFLAAGKTPESLSIEISNKLKEVVEEPNVTVILAESGSKVYYVLGQIEEPGQYSLNRQITVLQAISRAGGFLEWAQKSRIMIVSGPQDDKKISYFNYEDFLKGNNIEKNIVIKPEDTIVVP